MRRNINTVCFTLTQTLAKHTIAFQCHNFFDKALCTGALELNMNFFSYLSSSYQHSFIKGRKRVLTPRVTFFIKKIYITSSSTRIYIFYLSFLHYYVKNVTFFTIQRFFFVNNRDCLIHARIYPISLKYLFLNDLSCVAPMNREMG